MVDSGVEGEDSEVEEVPLAEDSEAEEVPLGVEGPSLGTRHSLYDSDMVYNNGSINIC